MRKLTVLLAAAALVSLCSLASAQQFFDDFESYTAGSSLHGQAGWKGWDDAAGATGYVSSKYAYSGTKSVEIVPASDLVHEFSAKGGLWRFSAMQYIPTGSTGAQYFILLNQYYTARDWSIQTQYIGDSGAITAQLPTNSGKTIIYDKWVKIEFIIDLDNNSYEEYYDGVKIAGGQWDDNAHGTLEAIDLFGNNATAIYYDDISLRVYRNSNPSDGQTNVARDAEFSWTATGSDITYDVYLGTSRDDVSKATRTNPLGVLVAEGQATATYQPAEPLEFGKTYYWRADEVGEITLTGEVWSFTVEPYLYPITAITATASSAQPDMEPQDLVNGVGLNDADEHSAEAADMWMTTGTDPKPDWVQFEFDQPYKLSEMWVWNSNQMIETLVGFGAKSVTVEYSADGQTWTALEDAPEFAQAPGQTTYTANTTVSFGGVTAKFVKLTINSTWGGVAPQTGLAEVRFYYVPVQAFVPAPADEATGVAIGTDLSWRPGREATSHKVTIGTDAEAVANGTADAATVTDNSYTPGTLDLATTYYWKVDEVGDTGTYAGDVWSFTTSDYDVIDDFEGYDDGGNRIFDAWIDGVTNKASGSQVGYDEAPFAERSIVHGGSQSMPLKYDNTSSPYYSEAEREFETAVDLTAGGGDTVSLYVQGVAPGFKEGADGTILMNSVGGDIWNNTDFFRFAYKTLNGNGSIVARVNSIYHSADWAKAGVMIRQSTSGGSVHAFMAKTWSGGNGASFQRRLTNAGASTNDDMPAAISFPYWVKVQRAGTSFTAYTSPDGAAWTQLGNAQTITMTDPVLIGLALCNNNGQVMTGAEFSDIATTGNVTGAWQVAEIGATQLEGNSVESMYLTFKDNAGKTATIMNPDSMATGRPGWTQWLIPVSDLSAAGVKVTAIESLTVGVGKKTSPSAGGTGIVYIDDIAFGKPVE
jgi:hypothetical protein